MTEANPPKPDEIPLEDIDRLLESEDPEFTKSLEEVRSVEVDKDVTIEASAIDESLAAGEEKFQNVEVERNVFHKIRGRLRLAWMGFRTRLKARLVAFVKDTVVFLKTRPKEFGLFLIASARHLAKEAMVPVKAYQKASKAHRVTTLSLIALSLVCGVILFKNLRGVWIPMLNEPILHSLEDVADQVDTYRPKDEGESFYTAFPQERFEYLFPKMKVNMKRTTENPNPMGAFEIIVSVDSKDTAIEVSDRVVEFSDLLQRTLEEETFTDLETELGKSRLKSRLKRELDQKLTQGWVKDVNFKTFVLKP